jgi:hypothetical protein
MAFDPSRQATRFDEIAEVAAQAFRVLPATADAAQEAGGAVPARRITTDADTVERDLVQLVLTIVELLRQLMERQALRRVDTGDLTEQQEERLGVTLMALDDRMDELCTRYDLDRRDLNLDLGPLGPLLSSA